MSKGAVLQVSADEWWTEAEMAEARAMLAMSQRAPAAAREALGMAALEVGGGCVTVMRNDPTGGVWNRVIGLGVDQPVSREAVDAATEFGVAHGAPLLVFQVAPQAAPAGWESILQERGMSPSATWAKLVFVPDAIPPRDDTSGVEELGSGDAEEFAQVLLAGFEMDPDGPQRTWMAGLARSGDPWRSYGVRREGRLVAVGWMHLHGTSASLISAATLPQYRRQGLHQALLRRRVLDAAAAGCAVIATETGSDTPSSPNPAVRSAIKAGFVQAYERRNWIWRPPG
jgi:GNAT superfamily N-acetyltransferase